MYKGRAVCPVWRHTVCMIETLNFPQSKSPGNRITQSSAATFSKRMPRPNQIPTQRAGRSS